MNDELQRMMDLTEGEGPSAEFRARLRAQIVGESERPDANSDVDVELVELGGGSVTSQASGRRRLLLRVAAVAAAAATAVWAAVAIDTDSTGDRVADADRSDTGVVTERLDPDAVRLSGDNVLLDPGTYRTDALGTAFTFDLAQPAGLETNRNAVVGLSAFTSVRADDRTLTLRRSATLPSPDAPTSRASDDATWPASDLAGWVDALGPAATAGEISQTTIGGFDASFVELTFDCTSTACRHDDEPTYRVTFTGGSTYHLWIVDQADHDPIVIVAAIDDDTNLQWLDDVAADVVASLDFDVAAPSPLRFAAAGATGLEAFDGVNVRLPSAAAIIEGFPGHARFEPASIDGAVELLTRPLNVEGRPVTTTEAFLELLEIEAVQIDERTPVSIGGAPSRVFTVNAGGFVNIVLKPRPDDLLRREFGWATPALATLWVIEHPERGLLLVTTRPGSPDAVAPIEAWAAELVASLAFESGAS